MNSQELRLKNLLQDYNGNVLEVVGLHNTCIYTVYPSELGSPKFETSTDPAEIKPIPLNKKIIMKLGYKDWGDVKTNEYEHYRRLVLFNFLDTSNHEVHIITSTYGGIKDVQFVTSIDNDDRQQTERLDFVHDLQNAVRKETGKEITF